jgi:hypothetical protein
MKIALLVPGVNILRRLGLLMLLLLGGMSLAVAETRTGLEVTASDFDCMLDMDPVRGFYVANLIDGKLAETLAIAAAGEGEYPAGSVVQLVPGEVMVKHHDGFSAVTKDWEFFELNVSAEGTQINKRGFADVINRFGGNCLGCHVKARPEFDMICETGHGCDPIPLTPQITSLLQKTDARCGARYTPTPQEVEILKALAAQLQAG